MIVSRPISRPIPRLIARALAAAACALLALPTLAQTTVKEPWVRSTVAQQMATGAFFSISSAGGGKLLSVSSPAAGVVEIHEMKMDGSTMKMRAVTALDLPAGKAVELKPGGYHVMLMDLKAPLAAGQSIALSLLVEGKDGKRETLTVKAPVKALNSPAAADTAGHKH